MEIKKSANVFVSQRLVSGSQAPKKNVRLFLLLIEVQVQSKASPFCQKIKGNVPKKRSDEKKTVSDLIFESQKKTAA